MSIFFGPPQDVASIVRNNIQKCFDCVIGPVAFKQSEMRWAAAMWVGLVDAEEDGSNNDNINVKFVYKIPCLTSEQDLDTIELELKPSQIRQLWER